MIQNLIKQQQKKVHLIMPQQGSGAAGAGAGSGAVSGINTSAAQNLILQSLKKQQLVSSGALLSQSGVVLTNASLSNLLRQQQLRQHQRSSVGGLMVTSGRTTTSAVNSTAVGSVSSIGMAAVGNGRLPSQDGPGAGSKLSGGGHIHLASGSGNQQGHVSNIKVSLTAGAASTNPFGSGSVSASMVSNGPTVINMDTGDNVGGPKFVSDSEIRLQEEKVRQLRQQVLAAQAAAKGSAVV
jgi:hypothetical protein